MTLRNHPSPTCVVAFTDGEIVRMTTWSVNGKPNPRRGIKLAAHTYDSRTKRRSPAIATLHFEAADGVTAARFAADQIAELAHDR